MLLSENGRYKTYLCSPPCLSDPLASQERKQAWMVSLSIQRRLKAGRTVTVIAWHDPIQRSIYKSTSSSKFNSFQEFDEELEAETACMCSDFKKWEKKKRKEKKSSWHKKASKNTTKQSFFLESSCVSVVTTNDFFYNRREINHDTSKSQLNVQNIPQI